MNKNKTMYIPNIFFKFKLDIIFFFKHQAFFSLKTS